MTVVSVLSILESTQLLRGLSSPWKARLADVSQLVHFKSGNLIFREGELSTGLYCVGSGLVRVVKEGPGAKQLVLHFANPGQSFGEVAVLGNFDAPASAVAVEDTTCAFIARDTLQSLLREHHELCLELLGSTARWVRSLVELIEGIVLRDSGSRLAHYLVQGAPKAPGQTFVLPVLKKDLAAHLNLTQETLSRTFRKFADCQMIESLPDGSVRLLDRDALLRVAQVGFLA